MRRSSKKLPRDTNQLAAEVVRLSTEEPTAQNEMVKAYLSAIGRKGGKKGGKLRAKALSPDRRSEIAREAANARWKRGGKKALPRKIADIQN